MKRPGMSPVEALFDPSPVVVAEVISRAASLGYEEWWARVAEAAFCAVPLHLGGRGEGGRRVEVMGRCKNRRASVCPSCSQLYAGDTWQLVHAGLCGPKGESQASIAPQPIVFATLTAPSFGPVHRADRRPIDGPGSCHPGKRARRCIHGRSLICRLTHDPTDDAVGQPLCPDCYDYRGHVLFNWHAPELWHRFGIALRRLVARWYRNAGLDPKAALVSYVKIVEMQRRGLVHVHTVVRIDGVGGRDRGGPVPPPEGTLDAWQLAGIIRRAATTSRLRVTANGSLVSVRFGGQVDVQPLSGPARSEAGSLPAITGRRVAAYLAKYVTKSVADFGLGARRLHEGVIDELDVNEHVRRILRTIVELSRESGRERMSSYLHTLGYRGHITTKTRHYSTTLGELQARREAWRRSRRESNDQADGADKVDSPEAGVPSTEWRYMGCGHANDGERFLAISAAGRAREMRRTAREELAGQVTGHDAMPIEQIDA